jgi:hypothetical protein
MRSRRCGGNSIVMPEYLDCKKQMMIASNTV